MHTNGVYLGVDGGFSGTRALIVDDSACVLGFGAGGNANHMGQGVDHAVRNVAAAVAAALARAELGPDEITGAFFALAGDDTDCDHAALTAALASTWPGLSFALGNDVWAGLRAGALHGHGVAVNCGSGTGAVGRTERGGEAIIPDLGYVFGDSGGGAQIATDALRAVSRAADGRGCPTALTALLMDLTGYPDVEALRLALYHDRLSEEAYRRITRLVFEAATGGDGVAVAILRRIGDELGLSCTAIVRRLGLEHVAFPLVLTGGTFRSLQTPLAAATIERAREAAPYCEPVLPCVMPVAGAALLAFDAAGREVMPSHYARLQALGYGWHAEETFPESAKEAQ